MRFRLPQTPYGAFLDEINPGRKRPTPIKNLRQQWRKEDHVF